MNLSDMTSAVYSQLSSAVFDYGVKVIKAYPYLDKPTRLEKAVIAVSPEKTELEPAGIGNEEQYGEIRVVADIFVPQNFGSEALRSLSEQAVKAALVLEPSGVGVFPIKAEDRLDCLRCSCTFTFKRLIDAEV